MTKASASNARQLVDELKDYIETARGYVEKGDFVKLEGLDVQVRDMCDVIAHLTVDEARQFRDELDQIMIELDALQQSFVASRDALGQGLSEVGKHKQASMAYKQSEHGPAREGMRSLQDSVD